MAREAAATMDDQHLVTLGVLERSGGGGLSLGDLGDQLRHDHPGGVCAFLDIEGAVGRADLCALHLLDAVRTGQAAYPLTYGLRVLGGPWRESRARGVLRQADGFPCARRGAAG